MNEIERITDQIHRAYDGDAWHGLPLRAILAGVSAEAASAGPIPGVHSIREIVRHITFWHDGARRRIGGEVVAPDEAEQWPAAVDDDERGWTQELADLERAHRELVEVVGRLRPQDLEGPVPGKPYDVYVLLHGLVQHNLFHAGQIALLKKAGTQ